MMYWSICNRRAEEEGSFLRDQVSFQVLRSRVRLQLTFSAICVPCRARFRELWEGMVDQGGKRINDYERCPLRDARRSWPAQQGN